MATKITSPGIISFDFFHKYTEESEEYGLGGLGLYRGTEFRMVIQESSGDELSLCGLLYPEKSVATTLDLETGRRLTIYDIIGQLKSLEKARIEWVRECVPEEFRKLPLPILADWLEERGRTVEANFLRGCGGYYD